MSKKSYTREKLKIKSFYGTYLEELEKTQKFARENGFTVVSMPQLTNLRVNNPNLMGIIALMTMQIS